MATRKAEKLLNPGLSYSDDYDVAREVLKNHPQALERAKKYLHERRKTVGSVDLKRDHWMAGNSIKASPEELARRDVRNRLNNMLKHAAGSTTVRKTVGAAMVGVSQPNYNTIRRRLVDAGKLGKKAPMRIPQSGVSARHARAMVTLDEVRLIAQEVQNAATRPRQKLAAKPSPVQAAIVELGRAIDLKLSQEQAKAWQLVGSSGYFIVDPQSKKVVGRIDITTFPESEVMGFLAGGADLECMTTYDALTQRPWQEEAEMDRWAQGFRTFAMRAKNANVALLASAHAALSEDNATAVKDLESAVETENQQLDIKMSEVQKAYLETLLPRGKPNKPHTPL